MFRQLKWTCVAAMLLALMAAPASASILSVSFEPASDPNDLTALGDVDWAHWVRLNDSSGGASPDQTPYPTERKNTATPYIGDLVTIDGGVLADVGTRNGLFTWTDGTINTVADTTNQGHANGFDRAPSYGVNVAGNPGLKLEVQADESLMLELSLFVSVFDSQATLTATLPGADNAVHGVTPENDTAISGVFKVLYRADGPDDVLSLYWKKTADYGNYDNGSIEAAAVRVVPEPAALVLLGTSGLLFLRRRK